MYYMRQVWYGLIRIDMEGPSHSHIGDMVFFKGQQHFRSYHAWEVSSPQGKRRATMTVIVFHCVSRCFLIILSHLVTSPNTKHRPETSRNYGFGADYC